jgi:hypothetical protein
MGVTDNLELSHLFYLPHQDPSKKPCTSIPKPKPIYYPDTRNLWPDKLRTADSNTCTKDRDLDSPSPFFGDQFLFSEIPDFLLFYPPFSLFFSGSERGPPPPVWPAALDRAPGRTGVRRALTVCAVT